MENEFEIYVLSYSTGLVTQDLATLTFGVVLGTDSDNALAASGATTVQAPVADVLNTLAGGTIDGLAGPSPTTLVAIGAEDELLNLYRFTATESGITGRSAVGTDAIFGEDTADTLIGTAATEEVYLREGDDSFLNLAGFDMVNGGPGTDTVGLAGPSESFTLTITADGIMIDDRRDPSDAMMVAEIEAINFTASQYDVTEFGGLGGLSGPELAQFIELYIAYFNRAPDALGLGFWGTRFAEGTTLEATAALFINQDETRATYPDTLSNADFATAVYSNVLGRVADQAGFDFWVGVLNDGSVSRDQFILEILRGAKAEPPAGADQAFIDQQLADRAYLSNKTDIGTYFAVTLGMSNVQNASDAMALFDGSQSSIAAAVAAIDNFFAAASDPTTGELLLPIEGVLDNPFPPQGPQLPDFTIVEDGFTVTEDVPTELNVLANDVGSGLSLGEFTQTANGTLTFVDTLGGRLLYTPNADFVGQDTFTYTASDGFGQSATVTATIIVEDDDVSSDVSDPLLISLDGSSSTTNITSELEDGFDVDWFTVDLTGNGAAVYEISLTGPSAAEAEIFVRTSSIGDPVANAGDDDTLFFAPDTGVTEMTIGVARDLGAADVPGEDPYTLIIDEIFPPDDLPASDETLMHVDLSGDGTWSSSDNPFSFLTNIEETGDIDWIGFFAGGTKTYNIATNAADGLDIDLIIRNAAGEAVATSTIVGNESFSFSTATGLSEQFYIEASAFGGVPTTVGTYELTVTEIV